MDRRYARLAKLFELGERKALGVMLTVLFMIALVGVVHVSKVPNPNMILISGLVICSAFFAVPGGLAAAAIMMAYTLWFFSTNGDFVTFTQENLLKVVVSAIGISVVTFFVSGLRQFVGSAFHDLKFFAAALEEDNRLLEDMSAEDGLTGLRNRLALRRDFGGYIGRPLHVMMMDLDDFKQVNDGYGHQVGDELLAAVGTRLSEAFGDEHVYRYGGDEFLVIVPDMPESEFAAKAREVQAPLVLTLADGREVRANCSAGYVRGVTTRQEELRDMIHEADMDLYKSKHSGKDRITSSSYVPKG